MNYEEIARGAVERHLGDVCCDGDESQETIYDEAYTLAHDALINAGADTAKAAQVAQQVAQCYAQP